VRGVLAASVGKVGKGKGVRRGDATVLYRRAEVGDGRRGGTTWQVGAKREREGEWGCPTGPADGTWSAGVGSVARPCRAAGPNRGGLGADQWGPDTVVGDGG
jgi:hypothetical protein